MKVPFVIAVLCIAGTLGGLTEEQRVRLKQHKEACIAETGVDAVLVENAKSGNIAADDEKLQCFALCILKRIGIYDAEGQFHPEVARAKAPADIPAEEIDKVLNRCGGLTGENACQTAGKVFACFLKTKSFQLLE